MPDPPPTPLLDVLTAVRLQGVDWKEGDRPLVVADGRLIHVRDLDSVIHADAAYVVGVNDASFDRVTRYLRPVRVAFYEMRVADIAPLSRLGPIEALGISWNSKLTSLEVIGQLSSLTTLSIDDTPKVRDLGPLGGLSRLRALGYSGGIWNRNTAETLEPIARLEQLEELRLTNIRVLDGGLRPLARCASLRRLFVSNQFSTDDFAYLSMALPETDCDMFAPYVEPGISLGESVVMVVGKGKPFLHRVDDAARLARYVSAYRDLQAEAAARLRADGT
jgi:hypothetical protein